MMETEKTEMEHRYPAEVDENVVLLQGRYDSLGGRRRVSVHYSPDGKAPGIKEFHERVEALVDEYERSVLQLSGGEMA